MRVAGISRIVGPIAPFGKIWRGGDTFHERITFRRFL